MSDQTSDFRKGHRQRLREKFLDGKLVDYEILELLLSYAILRVDVKPIAKRLILKFKSTDKIMAASIAQLTAVKGIGYNTAVFIKAVFEVSKIERKDRMKSAPIFVDYNILKDYCMLMLGNRTIEEFHVLYLDKNFKLIADDAHSIGTIDYAAVYPREIVRRALDINAMNIVLLHNHPDRESGFSFEDITLTRDIRRILAAVDIDVFDHILISGNQIHSAKNMHMF